MIEQVLHLLNAAGAGWLIAALAVVAASAFEAAKPAENAPARGALALLSMAAALIAPFLLLVHAFWAVAPHESGNIDGSPALMSVVSLIPGETLTALGIVALVLLLVPSLVGGLIGRAAPKFGAMLYRFAPWANAAALAFAVYVTYRNVGAVLGFAQGS